MAANATALPVPDDLCAVHRDYAADSDVMIITFSGLKRRPEGVPGFSYLRVLEGLPVRKLFLRDIQRAWYLRGLHGTTRNVRETQEFLAREIREQKARRVLLTGYSLGGFGALLYGALLGADEVQAFSPQSFISLGLRCWHRDHRWQRWVLKLHGSSAWLAPRDLRKVLAKSARHTRYHLHYAVDSPLDKLHAQRLADLPGVFLKEHESGRHRLVSQLSESGELRNMLARAVESLG